jgi:hypothetical protein
MDASGLLLLAATLRAVLVPFVAVLAGLLGILLVVLIGQRALRDAAVARQARRQRRCRPYVDRCLEPGAGPSALEDLVAACGRRDRTAVASLILPLLHSIGGEIVDRSRDVFVRLGLRDTWLTDLHDRGWWRRANGAHALGLIGEPSAVPMLVGLLDDVHDEVRAAALEALGRLADPETLPRVVSLLDGDAHQHARVVAVIRAFGPAAATELARQARRDWRDRRTAANVLGQMRSPRGLDLLLDWCNDADPGLRAACHRALGDIGLDERAYYFALRALGDPDVEVRAMAARALGRAGRSDAAPYLATHLGDDWRAAAQSAVALRQLGPGGRALLEIEAGHEGPGADLARQVLWETAA